MIAPVTQKLRRAGWLIWIAPVLLAGNAQETFNPRALRSALEQAPPRFAKRMNPYEGQPTAVLAGQKLFRQHCAECHGEHAEGTRRGPRLNSPWVVAARPGTLFWFLTNGEVRRGMPAWSRLPEPQRWQLVSFLRSLKPVADDLRPDR
jgi:mono/diheme cytochrome c family protein